MMVCVPRPTSVPAVGLCDLVKEGAGVQLSKAVTPPLTSGISAWQLALAETVVPAGQVTVGGVLSTTLTVNEQLGPAAGVQVTVVVPTGKNEPDAGVHVTGPQGEVGVV